MSVWLEAALSNAAIATLLAVAVAGVARMWRSPHLAHALWLLVMIKFITPPLLGVPFALVPEPPSSRNAAALTGGQQSQVPSRSSDEQAVVHAAQPTFAKQAAPHESDHAVGRWRTLAAAVPKNRDVLLLAWATGSALWIALCAVRIARFDRSVRAMPAAGDSCQLQVAALAGRLGLWRWPEVRLAEGVISPLLWAIGRRPIIVLPRALVDESTPELSRALLAHELAHFCRRDHWVRWLELVVLAVYWWNPFAWWARRRLQAAEEQCCDAYAIWLLDGAAHAYGQTLLATIDFLSEGRSVAPLAARGSNPKGGRC
jgi:bla regulator protein blaR1